MATFAERIIGAARLDAAIYEEVEADTAATAQAAGVVVLASLAAGIGRLAHGGVLALAAGTLFALVAWAIWAGLTYWIGTRLLPEPQTKADAGELLRTLGFSSAPGMIRVLAVIPGLFNIVFWIAGIWMLVAMIIAVRQALDYSDTWRALAVCAVGWIVQALVLILLVHLLRVNV